MNLTNKKSCVVNVRLYQNMIEIFDIYVSITIYLLQYIYIILGWKNIQHSMLANPDYNKISIENYYQEIFQIFMLALCLYITCSLTIFLSGSNNQPPMSYLHKEFNVLLNKKHQRIFPTTILASLKTLVSLIFHNKYLTAVLIEDITDMKCQLHHLQFGGYFIQQQKSRQFKTFMLAFMR